MIDLPASFTDKMKTLLGSSYDDYIDSFNCRPYRGLRVNTSKISPEELKKRVSFDLVPVPWTDNGFYYEGSTREVSSNPYYYLGLYYLQEPSAMAPAALLPVAKGDRVLDLCAAPGGKTTQLALGIQEEGLLISNDVSASRAKALVKNIELQGLKNTVVTCESAGKLASVFPEFFDKILIDAPCSGEGMFRSGGRRMVEAWKRNGPDYFSVIQREIAACAVSMLKPGGMMLYSTCTFDPSEDEQIIAYLLDTFSDLKVIELPEIEGVVHGDPSFCGSDHSEIRNTARFYPHKIRGEGHFAALLQKEGNLIRSPQKESIRVDRDFGKGKAARRVRLEIPGEVKDLQNIRFLRSGLLLGEIKNDKLIPSQSLAMTIKESPYPVLELSLSDQRAVRYLKGESLILEDADGSYDNGIILIRIDGFPAGWGQVSGRRIKNKLLPAWRLQS